MTTTQASARARDLRRIADQMERWARHDDVVAPGLDDAETLRQAAAALVADEAVIANLLRLVSSLDRHG